MARPRRYPAADIYSISKRCSKCGETRLLNEYRKDKNASDGLASTCKVCNRKRMQQLIIEKKDYYAQRYKRDKELGRTQLDTKSRTTFVCNFCKIEKTRDNFPLDGTRTSGISNKCFRCHTHKRCYACKEEKTLDNFYKKKDGNARVICKVCNYERHRKYRKENPIKDKFINRRYRIKHQYGITIETFNALYEASGKKCSICRKDLELYHRSTCIDHCHKTGQVRGILCHKCNSGLGYFLENKESLKNAISYLEKFE